MASGINPIVESFVAQLMLLGFKKDYPIANAYGDDGYSLSYINKNNTGLFVDIHLVPEEPAHSLISIREDNDHHLKTLHSNTFVNVKQAKHFVLDYLKKHKELI